MLALVGLRHREPKVCLAQNAFRDTIAIENYARNWPGSHGPEADVRGGPLRVNRGLTSALPTEPHDLNEIAARALRSHRSREEASSP